VGNSILQMLQISGQLHVLHFLCKACCYLWHAQSFNLTARIFWGKGGNDDG